MWDNWWFSFWTFTSSSSNWPLLVLYNFSHLCCVSWNWGSWDLVFLGRRWNEMRFYIFASVLHVSAGHWCFGWSYSDCGDCPETACKEAGNIILDEDNCHWDNESRTCVTGRGSVYGLVKLVSDGALYCRPQRTETEGGLRLVQHCLPLWGLRGRGDSVWRRVSLAGAGQLLCSYWR